MASWSRWSARAMRRWQSSSARKRGAPVNIRKPVNAAAASAVFPKSELFKRCRIFVASSSTVFNELPGAPSPAGSRGREGIRRILRYSVKRRIGCRFEHNGRSHEFSSGVAGDRMSGFFPGLACFYFEFFFDGREAPKDFMKAESHVADGVSLRLALGGQSGLQRQKFGVPEDGGESVVDVGAHLDHVAPESGVGLGGGTVALGLTGGGLGLAAPQNFVSKESGHCRPSFGFAMQLENGTVEFIEVGVVESGRGIGMNHDGRPAGGGERLLQGVHRDALVVVVVVVARGVCDREVVVAGLEVARKAFVEHDEFRSGM